MDTDINTFGIVFGDLLVDSEGLQYEKALHYAELVSKYTESPLWRDKKIKYNFNGDQFKCLKCGHVSPSKLKCMYCGSQEMEKMS